MVTEVLNCVCPAVEEYVASPSEAVRVYSLLTRFHEPANQQHKQMLSALHTDTQRLVHRLKANQVSEIIEVLWDNMMQSLWLLWRTTCQVRLWLKTLYVMLRSTAPVRQPNKL